MTPIEATSWLVVGFIGLWAVAILGVGVLGVVEAVRKRRAKRKGVGNDRA